jgi:hypothetical protein
VVVEIDQAWEFCDVVATRPGCHEVANLTARTTVPEAAFGCVGVCGSGRLEPPGGDW